MHNFWEVFWPTLVTAALIFFIYTLARDGVRAWRAWRGINHDR